MKKLFYLILFITSFFIHTNKHVLAVDYYSKYTRYSTNALLRPGPASWESNSIQYPNVIYDDGIYKMWYSGWNGTYWSVGYATSLDGINWFKYPLNPVLTWDLNANTPKHIITPSVIKDKGIYRMWFTSSFTDHDDYDFTIGYATSINGLNWIIQDFNQLKPSQNWDIIGLTHPFVLKISDNAYYLYYSARVTSNWNIGYATSNDGLSWTPYINNPIITSTGSWWEKGSNLGPYVIYTAIPKLFRMWYSTESLGQGSSSMAYAESTDGNSWNKPSSYNPILNRELIGYFDDRTISDGSVYIEGNSILLWYGAKGFDSVWNIGLSYYGESPFPLPTPTSIPITPTPTPELTLTPTLTLSPTPELTETPTPSQAPSPTPTLRLTPTPTPLTPIVIIPGMFASWNKDEMLENQHNQNAEWKLLGFVKEYEGIIKTLKNLGYKENENLFVWSYDWRKPVNDITTQLNTFLSSQVFSKPNSNHINLVGHSLGGLVARTWTQSGSNKDKVSHLITLGAPHQGVIQPYQAWEGGDATQGNTVLSFATQVLLQINKKIFQTDRETIQQTFPVLKDLLPSQPYLIRKSDNTVITKKQMYIWNTWQEALNNSVQSIYSTLDTIAGKDFDTPNKYIVTQPSRIDFLIGNWQDGKPDSTINEMGDGTVNTSRSVFSDDASYSLTKNHGDLIASKEGIQKILELLSIDYSLNQIIEGKATTFAPGLLFLLQSPATILVSYNGHEYHDQDGILFIPEAQTGIYTTIITGTGNGDYHLSIGQFGTNSTVWSSVTKTIQQNEKHSYIVSFQRTNPLPMPITNLSTVDWISQIEKKFQEFEKIVDKQKMKRLRIELALAKLMLEKHNYFIFKIQTEILLHSIATIQDKISNEPLHITFDIENLIGQIYISTLQDKPYLFSEYILKIEQAKLEKEVTRIINKITKKNTYSAQDLLFIKRGLDMFDQGKLKLKDNKLSEASFLFSLSQSLFETH